MNRRQTVAIIGMLFAIGAFAVFLGIGPNKQGSLVALAPTRLPSVEFRMIDGSRVQSGQLQGQVLLVDFWSTSCAICLAELPELQATYHEFKGDGLEVIAVAMPYDRPDHVLHYVKSRSLQLKVALDIQGILVSALGPVRGTPTRVLVSRSGRIVARFVGAMAPGQLRTALASELRKPSPAIAPAAS